MSNLLTDAILQFELREQIGEGGEGFVYKSFDTQLNNIIAIKKVAIVDFDNTEDFFEESRKLYLTRHHNVVEVNYACKDDEFIYLSMPYYANGSLKGLMDNRFLTAREIIRYSLQFLSGLNNIHSKGLIHFDIKPENILLSDSNKALISDFGIAQYMGRYGFAKNLGTTEVYAPPEYFSQARHNLKFDIYQAGLAIYRLCNGDADFESQYSQAFYIRRVASEENIVKNIEKGNFPSRNSYLPHIPKKLAKIINVALSVNPDDRYSSVLDMLNDLSAISNKEVNDWEYQTDNANEQKWLKDGYVVTCIKNGNNWNIKALKNNRQNNSYTKRVSTDNEKDKLLYKCLNDNW